MIGMGISIFEMVESYVNDDSMSFHWWLDVGEVCGYVAECLADRCDSRVAFEEPLLRLYAKVMIFCGPYNSLR